MLPGSARPYTSTPAPSIQQEHLLEITLQVNDTTNIFEESFQTVLSHGLLLTFLQASRLNQTIARRGAPLVTVKIFTLSRLSADNVLVEFAVLEDGNPMKAADVVEIFNRLPDLLGTLNDNLPFLVAKGPSAVTLTPAQFSGWLAAVVVLATVCVVLAALLGVFVKKSQGTERPDQNVQRTAFTPFKEVQLHAPKALASAGWPQEDAELGESGKKKPSTVVISGGPDLRTPGRSVTPSCPPRAAMRRKRCLSCCLHHSLSALKPPRC
ncbi:hypothetical protein AAFF_G00382860 [Aldrovandia affinis]|uniref:SEA domain-containing protein n=1 Tax=Aldrovandia affinis TaxID=143900 RepID=A0AAD7X1S1_9TELE|nr:hypothetical protein AAFF_G00382860 [Aldrovandia affinis]